MTIQDLINNPKATIVDVREPFEFAGGHVAGSINMPLGTVPANMDKLKDMSKPLILCCASGNRSGQATMFLQQQGFTDVYNGGGWHMVKMMKLETA